MGWGVFIKMMMKRILRRGGASGGRMMPLSTSRRRHILLHRPSPIRYITTYHKRLDAALKKLAPHYEEIQRTVDSIEDLQERKHFTIALMYGESIEEALACSKMSKDEREAYYANKYPVDDEQIQKEQAKMVETYDRIDSGYYDELRGKSWQEAYDIASKMEGPMPPQPKANRSFDPLINKTFQALEEDMVNKKLRATSLFNVGWLFTKLSVMLPLAKGPLDTKFSKDRPSLKEVLQWKVMDGHWNPDDPKYVRFGPAVDSIVAGAGNSNFKYHMFGSLKRTYNVLNPPMKFIMFVGTFFVSWMLYHMFIAEEHEINGNRYMELKKEVSLRRRRVRGSFGIYEEEGDPMTEEQLKAYEDYHNNRYRPRLPASMQGGEYATATDE